MGINQNDDEALHEDSQSLNPIFLMGVSRVFPLESVRIGKNGGRFLERDAMLCEIPGGFSGIPREHNLRIYSN